MEIMSSGVTFNNQYDYYDFIQQKTIKAGAVDRLTDTTKYTGSHKERFDDSGKGKGLDGRRDMDKKASEGYVGGYKGMDTYDEKH